jgi:hypothetical protein
MLYKFKSKAAGDVIMLGPNGDQVLRLIGREPAPQGIFEVDDMPAIVATLECAVVDDEDRRRRTAQEAGASPAQGGDAVGLRQRAWPLIEMMRRCHAAREVITWGA